MPLEAASREEFSHKTHQTDTATMAALTWGKRQSDKMKARALSDDKATGPGSRDRPLSSHSLSSLLTIQTAFEGKQRRPAGELTDSFSGG